MAPPKPKAKLRSATTTAQDAAKARRDAFVEAFITNSGNATQAAITAGFSPKTAYSQGSRLAKNVEVQAQIQHRRAEALELARANTNLTVEGVLRSVARAVLFDPRDLFHADGRPKLPHELDEDTALAVDGIEVEANSKTGKVTFAKYKTGRGLAREQALKHLGLFKADNEQPAQPLADAMLKVAAMGPLKDAFLKRLGART